MGKYGKSVETPGNIIRSRRRNRSRPNIDSWGTLHFETGFPTSYRIIHSQMFFKIVVLKNFSTFTGKHLCWNLYWIRLQAFRPAAISKRDSNTKYPREKLVDLQIAHEKKFWTHDGTLHDEKNPTRPRMTRNLQNLTHYLLRIFSNICIVCKNKTNASKKILSNFCNFLQKIYCGFLKVDLGELE